MNAVSNLRIIGVLRLIVMAVGTAGDPLIEGWPWFDGFSMVSVPEPPLDVRNYIRFPMPAAFST
ncbi:MAG: hypothetical protein WB762_11780 [Candidatus Sulfotelmatobacter sp.]